MIVLDLQLIFFHRLPRQARIRRWYPLLGSLFAFLLGIPYLCFPNVRLGYNGTMMVGNAKSAAAKVFVLWGQIWLHAGIIYSIIMVIAVCVKIYLAQSQLRRFGGSKLNESVSRSFAIVLFHPVISPNDKQSDSGTLLHSQFSTTGNLSTEKPVADIQTCPPQVKTMDMGPGVTGLFNDALGNDDTLSSTAGKNPHEAQGVSVVHMGDCTVNESALEPRNLFIEATTL
ncbi:hypothetical protein IWQ62_002368 [Dispira parvispora]|uniref:Uncharacterized protein n=1 Tax=Dispira parvispora TaxID=1520584 RepID=A0A9W8E7J4_9FUNG|nr:hypothetical protein IWQ62_002368 [Dispira parvispora]